MGTKVVRFTGARTGQKQISVYPYGVLDVGDTVEITDEEAERWTTQHATSQPGTAEDLAEAWSVDELRAIARDHGLSDKGKKAELAERIHEADPHIAPHGTASDFEIADTDEASVSAFSDKVGSVKSESIGDDDDEDDTENEPAEPQAEHEGVTDVG